MHQYSEIFIRVIDHVIEFDAEQYIYLTNTAATGADSAD